MKRRKSVKNIQVSLNSDIKTNVQLWKCVADFFLHVEWELFHKIFVEKIKTNFIFNNISEKSC